MASLLQKNWSAAQHLKALSIRLRNYGVRCGELDSGEILRRLPKEMTGAGNQGLNRVMDLSTKPGNLPENLQAMQSPFRSSLLGHVKKEAGQIPILHQTRPFSSLAAEQIQTSPNDTNKNILRPLSPHLPIYKPQLSSTLSIAHRITGAFLAASILSFHLLYLKMGPVCLSFAEFYQFLFYSSKLTMVSLELCVLAFAYHMFNGIHHLSRDFRGIIGKRFK